MPLRWRMLSTFGAVERGVEFTHTLAAAKTQHWWSNITLLYSALPGWLVQVPVSLITGAKSNFRAASQLTCTRMKWPTPQECTFLSFCSGGSLKTFLEDQYLKLGKFVVGRMWQRGNTDPQRAHSAVPDGCASPRISHPWPSHQQSYVSY